jgi:hypothetical protein
LAISGTARGLVKSASGILVREQPWSKWLQELFRSSASGGEKKKLPENSSVHFVTQ